MAKKSKTPWVRYEPYDPGEMNPLPSPANKDYSEIGQGHIATHRQLHDEYLTNKSIVKEGPWLAVVLKVLSGPQAKNEASTNGGNQTKALNIAGYKDATAERRDDQKKSAPIKIIARIPEIHTDINWPETVDDEARISAHSEFHQMDENGDFELIRAGSLVWVQFYSLDHIHSKSGFPSGIILGLYDKGAPVPDDTLLAPIDDFKPPCKAFRNLAEPGGGIYKGHTEANPVLLPGPPIRKYKNRIVTGLFGNGSLATKANFNANMQLAPPSFKHNIPGSAPDSNNAFIWVGQLKNNGYFDIFNRPGIGRETIIYAPYSLDVNSPIEIKYYFHDKDGFGNAFVSGEDDQTAAVAAAVNQESDFKNKIAPAIKDYIKDGRNIILVIPELLHSKGYNARIGFSATDKTKFQEQLSPYKISQNLDLSKITPFVNREVKSFNRTYIGGNFINFHNEVLNVVDSHIGLGVSERVDYVSMIGDGLGAITIAAMCENQETRQDLLNFFKLQRIDFVDTGLDNSTQFSSTFLASTPSTAIYTNLVRPAVDEEARRLQYNYITKKSPANTNPLFNSIDKLGTEVVDVLGLFKNNNSPPSGIGEQKFSVPVAFPDTTGGPTDVILSLHITKDNPNVRTGYALTTQNTDANEQSIIKPDTNSNLFSAGNSVPDHADAGASAQAAADLAKIQKSIDDLNNKIQFFESMIVSWVNGGIDAPCGDESPYQIYCKDGQIDFANGTKFFTDYQNYITDKIDLEEYKIINNFESQLLEANIYADRLNKVKDQVLGPSGLLEKSKQRLKAPYAAFGGAIPEKSIETLKKRFDINDFFTPASAQAIDTPNLTASSFPEVTNLAKIIAAPFAYQKILNKIDNSLEKLKSRAVKLSPECAPPPIKLGEAVAEKANEGEKNSPAVQACGDLKLALTDNFSDLLQMVNYTPNKSRFTFDGNNISTTQTKLQDAANFELGTFKYTARAANGQATTKESPPVWKCLTDRLAPAWEAACKESGYIPFEIVVGVRGYGEFKGYTAYTNGVSLHSFGLAFDVDPFITGYSSKPTKIVNSVFTGAWSHNLLQNHGEELYKLGVFYRSPAILIQNARQSANELRTAENWAGAPSAYKGIAEGSVPTSRYDEIMSKSAGTFIVPENANPTLWLLSFCETAQMRWGNINFLKKRHRGGKVWNSAEKQRIAEIYGIPNVVDRIKEISWKSKKIESHMHFQFWDGDSLVFWKDIK